MNQISLENVSLADLYDPLPFENPLRKMPVLILESGQAVFDSRVIVEYLDQLSGGVLIPKQPQARLTALTTQALCDGVMDAGALIVMEGRVRSREMQSRPWLDEQRAKIRRALKRAELDPPSTTHPQVDAIALACALGFIDRRRQIDWRAEFCGLADWLSRFTDSVPEYHVTHVPPEPNYNPP